MNKKLLSVLAALVIGFAPAIAFAGDAPCAGKEGKDCDACKTAHHVTCAAEKACPAKHAAAACKGDKKACSGDKHADAHGKACSGAKACGAEKKTH